MILVEVRMYNALVINVKFRILENNLNIVLSGTIIRGTPKTPKLGW
jgi:hypothetical protein